MRFIAWFKSLFTKSPEAEFYETCRLAGYSPKQAAALWLLKQEDIQDSDEKFKRIMEILK